MNTMMKQTLVAATFVLTSLFSPPTQAAWTKWYNLSSNADMQKLNSVLKSGTNRDIFKQVQCKQQGKSLVIRIDYRSTFEGGAFVLKVDWLKRVQ